MLLPTSLGLSPTGSPLHSDRWSASPLDPSIAGTLRIVTSASAGDLPPDRCVEQGRWALSSLVWSVIIDPPELVERLSAYARMEAVSGVRCNAFCYVPALM